MKFGFRLFSTDPQRARAMAVTGPGLAVVAEQLGFESVWVAEHLVMPLDLTDHSGEHGTATWAADKPWYDPWILLAAVAAKTSTLRLASSVWIVPLRHPVITARSVVTLDQVSQGRVILGAGVGWLKGEYDAMGESFKTRGRRMDEIVPLLRRLWSEDIVNHDGTFYTFGPVVFEPKPVRPGGVPIEIGGTSRAALERAARLGDGWIAMDTENLDELAEMIRFVHQVRKIAGRDHLPFEITSSSQPDLDQVRRLAEIGVTRVVARTSEEADLDVVQRFAEAVIGPMQSDRGLIPRQVQS
jgi:probable F420-dependent oxidoreductase